MAVVSPPPPKPKWWELIFGTYDPYVGRRDPMPESDYLKLRNEIVKERFIRLIQGWFVAVLALITVASIVLALGYRPSCLGAACASDPAIAAELQRAQSLYDTDQNVENTARLQVAKLALQTTGDDANVRDNAGWARTTLTAIIGFITGFIAARRVPPTPTPGTNGGDGPGGPGGGGLPTNPSGPTPPVDGAGVANDGPEVTAKDLEDGTPEEEDQGKDD